MIENNIYIDYYGKNNNFDVSLIQNNKFGRGIYFTNYIDEAKERGKRVIKAKLSIKNIIKDSYFAND